MAWNEPGGGRNNDPWGGRGGDQGPPDLDEAFRKLQSRLNAIFGGGGGGARGRDAGPGLSSTWIGIVVFAIVGIWAFSGIVLVDNQERGVRFRLGALQENLLLPGFNWYPRFVDEVELQNVTEVNSHKHEALMLSEDENLVNVSLTVQWLIGDVQAYVVNVRSPKDSLAQATESALRHVIGGSTYNEIITEGREAIGIDVQRRLQEYLDLYGTGITVSKVNIDQSGPPTEVKAAFDDVQKAKEDEQRVVNDAKAYAESRLPEARGEAQRQLEQANAYREQVVARAEGEAARFVKLLQEYQQARGVTRDRLYLDAMESVLSNSSKVLIDVDGGNNILYLPLDRIIEQTRNNAPSVDQGTVVRDVGDPADPVRPAPVREGRS